MSLKGMIIRCSSIIPEIREAIFRCLVCGYFSEPVAVEKGKLIGMLFVTGLIVSCKLLFHVNFALLLIPDFLSGRITEPTRCLKEECQARNSMTLVHNRCR